MNLIELKMGGCLILLVFLIFPKAMCGWKDRFLIEKPHALIQNSVVFLQNERVFWLLTMAVTTLGFY